MSAGLWDQPPPHKHSQVDTTAGPVCCRPFADEPTGVVLKVANHTECLEMINDHRLHGRYHVHHLIGGALSYLNNLEVQDIEHTLGTNLEGLALLLLRSYRLVPCCNNNSNNAYFLKLEMALPDSCSS